MKNIFIFSICFSIAAIILTSCSDDESTEPMEEEMEAAAASWNGKVKGIVSATCAYAGCHSGDTAGPYVTMMSNDFTSYAAITPVLVNGKFEKRALEDKTMPNPMFVPADKPTELTQDQLDLLQSWADAGYPEN